MLHWSYIDEFYDKSKKLKLFAQHFGHLKWFDELYDRMTLFLGVSCFLSCFNQLYGQLTLFLGVSCFLSCFNQLYGLLTLFSGLSCFLSCFNQLYGQLTLYRRTFPWRYFDELFISYLRLFRQTGHAFQVASICFIRKHKMTASLGHSQLEGHNSLQCMS